MKKGLKIGMMGSLLVMYVLFTYIQVITSSNISETTSQIIDYTHYSINEGNFPFNQPAKTENISISGISLPVIFHKNHSNNLGSGFTSKIAEYFLINPQLRYIHISEFISHRLLSFNIVFPFHYFW